MKKKKIESYLLDMLGLREQRHSKHGILQNQDLFIKKWLERKRENLNLTYWICVRSSIPYVWNSSIWIWIEKIYCIEKQFPLIVTTSQCNNIIFKNLCRFILKEYKGKRSNSIHNREYLHPLSLAVIAFIRLHTVVDKSLHSTSVWLLYILKIWKLIFICSSKNVDQRQELTLIT